MKNFIVLLVAFAAGTTALPVGNYSGSARVDFDIGAFLNKQTNLTNTFANQKTVLLQQSTGPLASLIPERPKGREQAVLEYPNWINKNSVYDYAQQYVANLLHPKPIVDTITEHEKYGNTGDQFRPIGNAIVGGFEGFSNFINAAVGFPYEAMKQATRKATSYLTIIGAKLVGL